MISKISINNTATYECTDITPTEINYFFGGNGSGKTTISKIIANSEQFPNCNLTWNTIPMQTIVYNRDFVKENFSQSSSIKGIFTLGKDSKDAKEFIESTSREIDRLNKEIAGTEKSLEKLIKDKENKTIYIADKCWAIMRKYEEDFKPAFMGNIKDKKRFLEKCMHEKNNLSTLHSWNEIKEKSEKIFNKSLTKYEIIPQFNYEEPLDNESSKILTTSIVGKEDVSIAILIKKLNNSDWVKEGLDYLKDSTGKCPFCQQDVSNKLKLQIEEFFDESYELKNIELNNFRIEYLSYINRKVNELKGIIILDVEILKFEDLISTISQIEALYRENMEQIERKVKLPSTKVNLKPLVPYFERVKEIVDSYREKIDKHNNLVSNLSKEKLILISEIWRFVTNELQTDLDNYQKEIKGIKKGILILLETLKEKATNKEKLEKLVKQKEAEVTSIKHAVNEINRVLKLFGFNNFLISEAKEKNHYKIVRENGTDVEETLSWYAPLIVDS